MSTTTNDSTGGSTVSGGEERDMGAGAERADVPDFSDDVVLRGSRAHPLTGRPFVRRFEAQARATPEATALWFLGQAWTYRALDERANAIAGALRGVCEHPDSLIGVSVGRTPDLVATLIGVHKAGGAYVPLDPSYPPARLRTIIQESRLKTTVVDAAGRAALAAMVDLERLDLEAISAGGEARAGSIDGHDLSHVIYTSGSTGTPKGVAIEHRSVAALLDWAERIYRRQELAGVLFATSTSFDLSVFEVMLPLSVGGAIILADNALALVDLPDRRQITLLNTVPSVAAELVRMGGIPETVRTINLAGEALRCDLVEELYSLPGVERIYNLYGPTEDTTYSTWALVSREERGEPAIGQPIDHSDAVVLDEERRPVPPGESGELYLGGAGLARGYLHRPDLTGDRFIDLRTNTGTHRFYRTGDKVSHDRDGQLRFHGRLDHQVKLRGFRVELGEVEAAVRASREVSDAIVIMRADHLGRDRLVAYVVVKSGEEVDTATLRDTTAKCLPDYMVPTAWVVLERLPLTLNGKIDRSALPPPSCDVAKEAGVPPSTDSERVLVAVWSEVLGIAIVDVNRGFLELGGDSLLAIRVVARAAAAGLQITARAVFEARTLAELAERAKPLAQMTSATGTGSSMNRRFVEEVQARYGDELEDVYPLTAMQEGLLLASRLEPEMGIYHVQIKYDMDGPLVDDAVRAAWRVMQRRHAVLRTAVFAPPTAPDQQVVLRDVALDLQFFDVNLDASFWSEEIHLIVAVDRRRGFQLDRGPLLRSLVLRGTSRWSMIVSFHHVILDGWSMTLLLEEWRGAYCSILRGEAPRLRARPAFREYVRHLVAQPLRAGRAYWRSYLEGYRTPSVFPRQGALEGGAAPPEVVERRLPVHLTYALEALCRREQTTLNTMVCAAWAILLSRYTEVDDIVFGVTSSGRTIELADCASMVGLLMITLPLRVRFSAGLALRELVYRLQADVLDGQERGHVPLTAIRQESEVAAQEPLFESLVVFENYPATVDEAGGGLRIRESAAWERMNLPVVLTVTGGGSVSMKLRYRTDVFDGPGAERLCVQLEEVLRSLVSAGLDAPHELLSLVGAGERRILLNEWSGPVLALEPGQCLHDLFEAQAAQTPDSLAAIDERDYLTYRELAAQSRQLARRLRALGVGRDVLVAVCMERSTSLLVALLGICAAGGAYVPIDPGYPAERVHFMLSDSAARVVLTESEIAPSLPPTTAVVICLDRDRPELAAFSAEPLESINVSEDLAYVIYTSGSTGRPKGVQISHRALAHFLGAIGREIPLDGKDELLAVTSISFDIHGLELFLPLVSGARVRIAPREVASDGVALRHVLEAEGVTVMQATPATWRLLVAAGWGGCPRLRALCGGEALPLELARELLVRSDAVWNLYGPTEATIWATLWRVDPDTARVSIGKPLANTSVYVLDQGKALAPIGVAGELYIGGVQVARGYLNRPSLTEERFVPDPFAADPSARMYRSGDRARWGADGRLYYLGRLDYQVKCHGHRVELGEIESALERRADVGQAVVMVEGEGEMQRLVAWVASERAGQLTEDELRGYLGGILPRYMVPARFVALGSLPQTANGKVDRKRLPAPGAVSARDEGCRPVGELEDTLRGLWSSALGEEVTSVRRTFFDLGGNSLQLARVGVLLKERLGLAVSMMDLLRHPTIERLADHIRGSGSTGERGRERRTGGDVGVSRLRALNHSTRSVRRNPR